jgi:hypothetical protein
LSFQRQPNQPPQEVFQSKIKSLCLHVLVDIVSRFSKIENFPAQFLKIAKNASATRAASQ